MRPEDSLRLGLLYSLRNEGSGRGDLQKVEQLLLSRGHTDFDKKVGTAMLPLSLCRMYICVCFLCMCQLEIEQFALCIYKGLLSFTCYLSPCQMLKALLEHSGGAKRGSDLFDTQAGTLSRTKKFLKGLKVRFILVSIIPIPFCVSLFHSTYPCSILSVPVPCRREWRMCTRGTGLFCQTLWTS